MPVIEKYRSVFKEKFICPYIHSLKRSGFTDKFDKKIGAKAILKRGQEDLVFGIIDIAY